MKKIILTFIVAALSFATSYAQSMELDDPNTLLVLFPANTSIITINQIRAQYNVTEIKVLPNTGVRIWRINSFPITIGTFVITNSIDAANHIKSSTEVSSDPNYTVAYAPPTLRREDTAGTQPYNMEWARIVNNKLPSMICPIGNKKIIVAIADCGIGGRYTDATFNPSGSFNNLFAGKIWKNTDRPDTIDNDNNGYVNDYTGWNWVNRNNSNIDNNDHGSHVSGIVAQMLNRARRVPVLEDPTIITNRNLNLNSTTSARTRAASLDLITDIGIGSDIITNPNLVYQNVTIMSLKTQDATGKGSLRSLIEAIDYAMGKNANIMNLSLSYKGKRVGCEKSILKKVIDTAGIRKKMLFVVAAGNNNFNLDGNSDSTYFPAYFNSVNMIVVGADSTTETGQKASFSNYGAVSVDIAASGTKVYSTFKNGWGWMSGTSMAAPHVTAVAALLGTQQIWNYATIKNAILNASTSSDGTANGWIGKSNTGKTLNISAILGCYENDLNDLNPLRAKSNNTQTDWAELAAIPNPFSDFLQIQINSQQAAEGELFIQNALGQVVYHQKVLCQQGQNVVEWQSSDVVKGIYIVKVLLPNRTLTQKILKQ